MENFIKTYIILMLKQANFKTDDIIISFISGDISYINKSRGIIGTETLRCEIEISPLSKHFNRLDLIRIFKPQQIEINNIKVMQRYIGFVRRDMDVSEATNLILKIDFTYDIGE